jgi:hypothetical protein
MRWTAAGAAVIVLSIWAVANAQTETRSPLSPNGGSPPALEDGGVVSRPFSATPDGGVVATFGQPRSSIQVQRKNGVDYVGSEQVSAAAPDAGTTAADNGARSDAGTQPSAEVEDLRRRIATLEQRLQAAEGQQQEMRSLNTQVSELRQQLADAETQRLSAQQQTAEAGVRTRQAVTSLQAAQQALASGNGDVAGTLANVAPSLPPAAQMEITAAQQSLQANDLYGARTHIAAAIAASSR